MSKPLSIDPCPCCDLTGNRLRVTYLMPGSLPVQADQCYHCGAVFVDMGENWHIYSEGRRDDANVAV